MKDISKRLARHKHSSLFVLQVSDEENKFYTYELFSITDKKARVLVLGKPFRLVHHLWVTPDPEWEENSKKSRTAQTL